MSLLGMEVDTIDVPLVGGWDGRRLTLNGPLHTGTIRGPDLNAAHLTGPVLARWSPGAPLGLEGELELVEARLRGIPADLAVDVKARGTEAEVAVRGDARSTAIDLEASVDLLEGRVEIAGGTVSPPGEAEPWRIAPGGVSFTEGGVAEIEVQLMRGGATVSVRGDLDAATVEMRNVPLAAAEPWTPGVPAMTGHLSLSVAVVVEALDLSVLDELRLPTSPTVSAEVELSGSLRSLRVAGAGTAVLHGLFASWTLEQQGPRLHILGDVRAADASLATFEGSAKVPLDGIVQGVIEGAPLPAKLVDDVEAEAVLEGFPLRSLLALGGLEPDVDGLLEGRLRLVNHRPSGHLELHGGRIGVVQMDSVSGRLADGELDAGAFFSTREGTGGLRIVGSLPVQVDPMTSPHTWINAVDLQLSGRGVPVVAVSALHPALLDGVGWLKLEGRVAGTPTAPEVDGRAEIKDGALTLRRLGLRVNGLDLLAEMHGAQLTLKRLAARTSPSRRRRSGRTDPTLEASGEARVGLTGLLDVKAIASLDHALVVARRDQSVWPSTSRP